MNDNDDHRLRDFRTTSFPTLAALGLTAGDMGDLATQGFESEERRGDRTYYKLRFRRRGKQFVRYIGSADRAAIVNNELVVLQSEAKLMRNLKTQTRIAKKILRESKRTLEPALQANGYAFHGLAIRRPRQQQTGITTYPSS